MSVFVVPRTITSGAKRYHVRWQRGRGYPQVHLGSFKTLTAARKRQEWAELELAAGRFPDRHQLEESLAQTLSVLARAYEESRTDLAANSRRAVNQGVRLIERDLGNLHPTRVTVDRVQAWVSKLAESYAVGSINLHLQTLQQVLDYARVSPNPARDRSIRKPRRKREPMRLPSRRELATLYAAMPEPHVSVLRLIEATGLRICEAVALEWRDLEQDRRRLLVRESKTNAGTRWVDGYDPPPRPAGVEPGDRVFMLTAGAVQSMMYDRTRKLGMNYSPHDLRHLYGSRAIDAGESPVVVSERMGHSNPGITLGTYAHRPPPD